MHSNDGQMDEWMDVRINNKIDGHVTDINIHSNLYISSHLFPK